MSDATALTVPPAGWYPDRSDSRLVRWWDGGQWTDHTHSIAPEQAVEQPVSAAAFGFTPVEPNPVAAALNVPIAPVATAATAAQAAPGWYPDNADRTIQRWWDGTQWTAHTAPGTVIPTPTPDSYLGSSTTPVAPAVNTMATRGMTYSLIGLVLNPFFIMSIGGLVLGIRGLRRVPQFAPENARRGPALAAIIVGSVATVLSILVVLTAIAIPVYQAQHPHAHVFDQVGAEQDIMTQLVPDDPSQAPEHVSCPPDPAMKVEDTFDCTAYLVDGETLPVHITIDYDGRIWTYTWKVDMNEASGNSGDPGDSGNPGNSGDPGDGDPADPSDPDLAHT